MIALPRTARPIVMSFMAVALVLGALEIAFRIGRAVSGEDWRPQPYDKILHHPYPPGWKESVALKRKDGTKYVVALGDSTTRGWPYGPEAAFPAWIAAGLNDPGGAGPRVEVINLGMDSLDTGDALDILEALAERPVDLFLVYSGHNEFTEHYLSSRSSPFMEFLQRVRSGLIEHSAAAQWLNRWANGRMRRLFETNRLNPFILLNKEYIFTHDPEAALARFPFPETERKSILDRYLARVEAMARRAGADRILFLPPVSNPLGLKPYRSAHAASSDEKALKEAEALSIEGFSLLDARPEEAVSRFRQSIHLDPGFALYWYGLGVACLRVGEMACVDEASEQVIEREAVMHRLPLSFRRALIATLDRLKVAWIDVIPALALPESVTTPDPVAFLDFVHPHWLGHRRIAEAALPAVATRLGLAVPSEETVRRRMDRHQQQLTERPDWDLAVQDIPGGLGWLYLLFGNLSEAMPRLEKGIRRTPDRADFHLYLSMAYQRAGRTEEARHEAGEAFRLAPKTLGAFFGSEERFEREWIIPNKQGRPGEDRP